MLLNIQFTLVKNTLHIGLMAFLSHLRIHFIEIPSSMAIVPNFPPRNLSVIKKLTNKRQIIQIHS